MPIYNKKQLIERYQNLPPEVQQALINLDAGEVIEKIGKDFSLRVDQMGELADEIGLVMLGLEKSDSFLGRVSARLRLPPELAQKIVEAVNQEIFVKIREELRRASEIPLDSGPSTSLEVNSTLTTQTNTTPDAAAKKDLFEEKMGKLFRIPREEVEIDPYLEKPE